MAIDRKKLEITAIHLLVNGFAFIALFLYAVSRQWDAVDLVWGFWSASLVCGYVYLFTAFIAIMASVEDSFLFHSKNKLLNKILGFSTNVLLLSLVIGLFEFSAMTIAFILLVVASWLLQMNPKSRQIWGVEFLPPRESILARLISPLPVILFILSLFSVHYLFVHFVESILLSAVIPHPDLSLSFKNLPQIEEVGQILPPFLLQNLKAYLPIVLAGLLSRLDIYLSAARTRGLSTLYMPYKYILRMQSLIVIFTILHLVGLSGISLYPVLILFFLPIGSFVQFFAKKQHIKNHQQHPT